MEIQPGMTAEETLPLGPRQSAWKDDKEEKVVEQKRLNIPKSSLLMTGAVAGVGLVAMPTSLKKAGWTGLVLMLVILSCAGYCAGLLGRCWTIVRERYPEARTKVRRPYAMIGEKAVGAWMGTVITLTLDVAVIPACVILLLLVAENLQSMLENTALGMSKCLWLIIICAIITPLSWLDTPKDFWWTGPIATSTTGIAFILVLTALFVEASGGKKEPEETNPSLENLLLAIGTMLGSTGSPSFPTIQHDMIQPEHFSRAAVYAYFVIAMFYVPTSILAYYVYGRNLGESVLTSLPRGGLRLGAEVAISAHCLFACLISINPVLQSLEGLLDTSINHKVPWKRCCLRTLVIALILFCGETVPRYGPLLNLVGGGSYSFLVFIAPALFYLCLCSQKGEWPAKPVPLHTKVLCIEIIIVGSLMAIATTVTALQQIFSPNAFEEPCYIP